jgi:hypothetical protein
MKLKSIFWLQNSYGQSKTICYCGDICIGFINLELQTAHSLFGNRYANKSIHYNNVDDARKLIEDSFTEFINQFIEGD